MIKITEYPETGSFVKFLCCNCGEIHRMSCRNLKSFHKFKDTVIEEGLCKACGSENVILKNGNGEIFDI